MYYNNYTLHLLTCFVFYSIFKDSDAFSFHNLYCVAGASTCDFSRCCCFSLATRRGKVTDVDTREERLVLNHPSPRRALSGLLYSGWILEATLRRDIPSSDWLPTALLRLTMFVVGYESPGTKICFRATRLCNCYI